MIRTAQKALADALNPKEPMAPPTDQKNVEAFTDTAAQLNKFAGNQKGQGADAARRLATALATIARGNKDLRDKTEAAFLPPLQAALEGLSASLTAQPVTLKSLPPELVRGYQPAAEAAPEPPPPEPEKPKAAPRRVATPAKPASAPRPPRQQQQQQQRQQEQQQQQQQQAPSQAAWPAPSQQRPASQPPAAWPSPQQPAASQPSSTTRWPDPPR